MYYRAIILFFVYRRLTNYTLTFLLIHHHYSLTSSAVKKMDTIIMRPHLDTREVSKTSRQDEMISKVVYLSI